MTKEIDYKNIKVVGDGRGTMQGDYLLNKDRRMDAFAGCWNVFPNGEPFSIGRLRKQR